MRDVSVAVPASFSLASLCHHVIDASSFHKLLIQLRVATNAVVHYNLGTGILGHNGLMLAVSYKISHVLKAVGGFEGIFLENIIMWNVAIVTRSVTAMARLAP